MQSLLEAEYRFRSLIKERTAASVEAWEFLQLMTSFADDMARASFCYEKDFCFRAVSLARLYEWKRFVPDFAGKVRNAWYRNFPLRLVQDESLIGSSQTLFTNTTNQPLHFHYDGQVFGLRSIPTVTEYTTGTVTVTQGSRTVTGVGTLWLTGTDHPSAFWGFNVGTNPLRLYPIRSVDSETQITLEEPWYEQTAAGQSYVASDGPVRLKYAAVPTPFRVVAYATNMAGNMTVTNGSRSVSSSGAPALLSNALRGMVYGSGTATGSTKPTKWYPVDYVVSNTALSLAYPWEEPSQAGSGSGVLSDANPFEAGYLEAVVARAAGEALARSGKGAELINLFEMRKVQIRGEVEARYNRHAPPPTIPDRAYGYIPGLDDGEV